jgi:hypothetical protein
MDMSVIHTINHCCANIRILAIQSLSRYLAFCKPAGFMEHTQGLLTGRHVNHAGIIFVYQAGGCAKITGGVVSGFVGFAVGRSASWLQVL